MTSVVQEWNYPGTSSRQAATSPDNPEQCVWAVLRYYHGPNFFRTLTSEYCPSYEEARRRIHRSYIDTSPTPSDWVMEESNEEPKFFKATLSDGLSVRVISTLRVSVQLQSEGDVRGNDGQHANDRRIGALATAVPEHAAQTGEQGDASWAPSHRYVLSANGTIFRWPDANIPITQYSSLGSEEWGVVDTSSLAQYDGEGRIVLQDEGWDR